MKTNLIAALAGIALLIACSQNPEKVQTSSPGQIPVAKKEVKEIRYKCPQCGYGSDTAGDCPKDHIGLVKIGDYYCPECFMTDTVPGKCKMCNVDRKRMEK